MYSSNKLLFSVMVILGTMIAIASQSWVSMWIGLEVNLLSMIPLLKANNNLYPAESAIKYFVTQALASAIILFSAMTSLNLSEFATQTFPLETLIIMNSALLTKVGAAPFHAWFPEVIEGLSWNTCLIMLTWQKIAPLILLIYNSKMTTFMCSVIIISAATGSILGINQTSMRKIMAYSSINHMSWMIASLLNSHSIWAIYFLSYTIMSANIITILKTLKIFYLSQMFSSMNHNKLIKFFFVMNFLALGGLPPFLGFFPKWLVINSLVQNNFLSLGLIMILFTLVTLFFYLRITFSTLVIKSTEPPIQLNKINKFSIYFSNIVALTGLIACTLIFNFL
uniref:NADH-ubiquinone oxidoreductase chain 2 n=1 Tax=Papunya picta TaxID=2546579 RepID=A0A6H0N1P3_9CUCU|nr:NADH dehydrogenase subunit 2 [Papunya picta]